MTASILADFYVLDDLRVDIIFGEDLLATVNAFVHLSSDFNEVVTPTTLYPGLATMGLVKKNGMVSTFYGALGKKTTPAPKSSVKEQDDADSKELDRHRKEKKRIEGLKGSAKSTAEEMNEKKRREYEANR